MFNAEPTDNDPDLFDLAATLAGCAPVELLKVRRDPAGLVVILLTGQKFVFNIDTPSVETAIRARLASVLGIRDSVPPDPEPVVTPGSSTGAPAPARADTLRAPKPRRAA